MLCDGHQCSFESLILWTRLKKMPYRNRLQGQKDPYMSSYSLLICKMSLEMFTYIKINKMSLEMYCSYL